MVSSGLQNGDQVVVMGGAKVKPDQAVEVRALPPTGAAGSQAQNAQAPQQAGQNSVVAPKEESGAQAQAAQDTPKAQ